MTIRQEFLVIGRKQQLSKVGDLSIQIGQDKINSSAYMRNLGFYFDQNMKNTAHVNQLIRSFICNTKRPSVKQSMKWQVSSKLADLG